MKKYGRCAPLLHPRASTCICIAVGSSCHHVYNVKTYFFTYLCLSFLCASLEEWGPPCLPSTVDQATVHQHFNISATEPASPQLCLQCWTSALRSVKAPLLVRRRVVRRNTIKFHLSFPQSLLLHKKFTIFTVTLPALESVWWKRR